MYAIRLSLVQIMQQHIKEVREVANGSVTHDKFMLLSNIRNNYQKRVEEL